MQFRGNRDKGGPLCLPTFRRFCFGSISNDKARREKVTSFSALQRVIIAETQFNLYLLLLFQADLLFGLHKTTAT